jgi:hypothetical protein
LIEHGVRYVEVGNGGWDMHQEIYSRLPEKSRIWTRLSARCWEISKPADCFQRPSSC